MFKRLFSAALVFGLASTAPPAAAQQRAYCAPRALIAERLTTDFGETLEGIGLQSPRHLVEIWAAPGTGTWTIFVTRADGIACVVASGEFWQDKPAATTIDRMGVPG